VHYLNTGEGRIVGENFTVRQKDLGWVSLSSINAETARARRD
jgi:hypothetical protein